MSALTHDFLGKALEPWRLTAPGIIVDCIEMDSELHERALLETGGRCRWRLRRRVAFHSDWLNLSETVGALCLLPTVEDNGAFYVPYILNVGKVLLARNSIQGSSK
jgi:hypothetical protein